MYAWSVILHAAGLLALRPAAAAAKETVTGWLELSWLFSWTPPSETYPVPTTAQCETLDITWGRQTATGPDPYAPYSLHIYTSNYNFPFIIPAGSGAETSLTIPFAPGTQYQICMFDINNSTGGCQAIYSVYPNTTTPNPSCANFTMPAMTLEVLSEYSHGNLSEYGWVDSCSNVRVTPLTGTPPFTFMVSPALHPPFIIESNDMSPINWTVALSWASPFFISLVDSKGLSWSHGPIHSGNGRTFCLSDSSGRPVVHVAVAGGAAVAGTVVGALGVLLAGFIVSKRRGPFGFNGDKKITPFYHLEGQAKQQPLTRLFSPSGRPLEKSPALPSDPVVDHIGQVALSSSTCTGSSDVSGISQTSNRSKGARRLLPTPALPAGNSEVFLIHQDSGRLVTSRGDNVIELPPGYSPNLRDPSLMECEEIQ